MKTAHYISELLYRYECVIIPGFGAFLTQRQSAKINETTHAFQPPKKLISFNNQLQNNDGLLANYIAMAEKITYTAAVSQIQQFVISTTAKLQNGEHVQFNAIGSFYYSEESTLCFEPSDKHNFLTEAFGLNSFVSPAVKREVYKEKVVALEEKAPIAFTPEKRNQRPYLKYAAAAIVTIGLSGLWSMNNSVKETQNQELVSSIQLQETQQKEIQEATFDILSPLPPAILNLTLVNQDDQIDENEVLDLNYHIVAGAYRIEKNANKKIKRLKAQGYNAHIIGVNQYGLHQVVYNSYATRNEADNALQNIRENTDQGAWLLIQDL